MLSNGAHHAAAVRPRGQVEHRSGLKAGRIYTRIKQPYFFSYVIDELEREYGANTVREGGLKVYTTIDPRLQRNAVKAIRDILPYRTDPASAIVSVEPGTGAIRAMTAVVRSAKNQFNLAAQSASPGRLDVQDVRARVGDRAGRRPRLDVLHLGAVHVLARPVVPGAVTRCTPTATTTTGRCR